MDSYEYHEYINAQKDEILKYKWILSEEAGYDIGNHIAAVEWIKKYSAKFRIYWFCQHCPFYDTCNNREEGKDWDKIV